MAAQNRRTRSVLAKKKNPNENEASIESLGTLKTLATPPICRPARDRHPRLCPCRQKKLICSQLVLRALTQFTTLKMCQPATYQYQAAGTTDASLHQPQEQAVCVIGRDRLSPRRSAKIQSEAVRSRVPHLMLKLPIEVAASLERRLLARDPHHHLCQ